MLCTANYEGVHCDSDIEISVDFSTIVIIIIIMKITHNHAARKFGVRAAMPGFVAKQVQPRGSPKASLTSHTNLQHIVSVSTSHSSTSFAQISSWCLLISASTPLTPGCIATPYSSSSLYRCGACSHALAPSSTHRKFGITLAS
jgi:hypothetical protein